MSDGRAFTSYVSNCEHNQRLMRQTNITDNNTYRKYLQDNAEAIMRKNHLNK